LQIAFGITDRPRKPDQILTVWDLAHHGNLLAIGAPQSGRTTLLRTLAGCICTQLRSGDAHLYVIDGRAGLGTLAPAPAMWRSGIRKRAGQDQSIAGQAILRTQ
jgi:S-DNA-T family DNA segregation ATPase FtsK/SpoIIIE